MAELCKSKYSVRIAKYEGDLVVQLKDYYSSTSLADMKVNIDFISHICNCVEQKFTKDNKRYKVDKKAVVISIIKKLTGDISDQDLKTIQNTIESLHSSDSIKGKTVYMTVKGILKNLLKKLLMMK